jgi:hypothetical protein
MLITLACRSRVECAKTTRTIETKAAREHRQCVARQQRAFVLFIALLESAGNDLGTLAFVLASVAMLGGFRDNLSHDF